MAESASPEFLALQQALAGRYSLVREIGRGGMGVVYLARDVALDRSVAIKLLPPSMASEGQLRERFLREARTAAQLSHPNIVPIHLVEEREGLVYFVMALIEGESVGERVRRTGPLVTGEAIRMIQEVAWALAYAHGKGVVHRDVKPDNVMLERASGRAMLTDFGIARSPLAGAHTTPGLILGSLQYMAPEQADPHATIDGRADLYALGVTAFFAVTGRLPFTGDRPEALLAAHMLEPAPPIGTLLTGLPSRLAEAIDRCLVKDPGLRWPTGEALADALSEVGQNVRSMPPSIRTFTTSLGSAFAQITLLGVTLVWASIIMTDQMPVVLKLIAAISILPLIAIWEGARAVAIAGFTATDVAQAVLADRRASDRYTEYVRQETGRMYQRVNSPAGRVIVGIVGAFLFVAGGVAVVDSLRPRDWWETPLLFGLGALQLWVAAEGVGHALQIGPFKNRLMRFMEANLRRQENIAKSFWSSRLIRGILTIGRWTTRRKPHVIEVENRPTEALLASAAADIFSGLPSREREALESVPRIIRELEANAASLRARKSSVDAAISAVGDPGAGAARGRAIADMEFARDRVAEQLRSTVEALENLRLDLLRVRAGVGSTADLTDAIEAARGLGQDIDYTLAGRAEVARANTPI